MSGIHLVIIQNSDAIWLLKYSSTRLVLTIWIPVFESLLYFARWKITPTETSWKTIVYYCTLNPQHTTFLKRLASNRLYKKTFVQGVVERSFSVKMALKYLPYRTIIWHLKLNLCYNRWISYLKRLTSRVECILRFFHRFLQEQIAYNVTKSRVM